MATSNFRTTQYTSEQYVESAGAIPFDTTYRQVCLVFSLKEKQWLLAKGRRNLGESRHAAALGEVKEETGYTCRILPLDFRTKQTSPFPEISDSGESTEHINIIEPFMLTHRELDGGNVKLIWWYIAEIDFEYAIAAGEDQFQANMFTFDDAVQTLTFESDRVVLRRAIEIFKRRYG